MRRSVSSLIFAATAFLLAGCEVVVDVPPAGPATPPPQIVQSQQGARMSPAEARQAFAVVTRQVEPVAEQICRDHTTGMNCDFLIRIDPDVRAQPNAYQSLDRSGRPVITFTQSMLAQLRNRDELAFVMSHEAAHHIRGHLARQQQNAAVGAVIFAGVVGAIGGSASSVSSAQDIGATVGARSYSKNFELEADELGTLITHKSGYRPSVGVLFFYRLPDPGDRFLGSHPANPDRVRVVQQTIDRYGLD